MTVTDKSKGPRSLPSRMMNDLQLEPMEDRVKVTIDCYGIAFNGMPELENTKIIASTVQVCFGSWFDDGPDPSIQGIVNLICDV